MMYYSKNKPVKPYMNNCMNPQQMLSKLSLMRKRFIENNNINYYLIEINIHGKQIKPHIYYKSITDSWTYRCRKLDKVGEPSCD